MFIYIERMYEGYIDKFTKQCCGQGRLIDRCSGLVIYEGSWSCDTQNGYGIMHFANNKARYEGCYKDGKRHGLGIVDFLYVLSYTI